MLERGLIMVREGEALDLQHLSGVDDALNVAEFLTLDQQGELAPESLPLTDAATPASAPVASVAEDLLRQGLGTLSNLEDALVRSALKQTGGNVTRAATLLGITRSQMDYRARKIKLAPG